MSTVVFNERKQQLDSDSQKSSQASLRKLLETLPRELKAVRTRQGLNKVLFTSVLMVIGFVLLHYSPWWLLPLGWLFIGTVATGLQAIGYDVATGLFSRHAIVNEIVGHLVTLPLLVPFESWKMQLQHEEYEKLFARMAQTHFWFASSIVQWLKCSFAWHRAFQQNRLAVAWSVSFMFVAAALTLGTIFYFGGLWAVAKYWFFPWCVYHFWMTTFITTTYKRREGKLEKVMVVHIRYPQWVELLTHNMNYIMSAHRQSLPVPSYNLRQTYSTLRNKLDNFMEELSFRSDFWATLKQSAQWWFDMIRNLNGISALFILTTPLISIYGLLTTEIHAATVRFAIVCYFVAGLGITVGYHRYLSHRAFDSNIFFRYVMVLCGTAAFQGSAIWWCQGHRAHHRFSDTPKDPYGVDRGFFWAHMGWLLVRQDKSKIGKTDCSDLENDPLLQWQQRWYFPLAFLLGIVVPTAICGIFWNDWRGGFFIASMCRIVVVMQSTFCINSLAHYWGEQTYSDYRSSRDNFWVSLVTLGEGYHNFHHEFPYDFRNGLIWYAFDPSKWVIWLLSLIGVTYNLKRFPRNEIDKGVIQMKEKRLNEQKKFLKWGPSLDSLPEYTWQQVKELVSEGANLIVFDGIVHDVADFMKVHPGGEKMISCRLGTDITEAFNGGVYNHANGARNLMEMFRVGRIKKQENDEKISTSSVTDSAPSTL